MRTNFQGDGVFPIQWLQAAAEERHILSHATIPDANFQPASLDLRLGETAYRLRCSFLPGESRVEPRLAELCMGEVDLRRDGGILEQNRPYLIPLLEELRLPEHVWARSNPKSSTGRLDVFTRVITDYGHVFDDIRAGYKGRLWLEVVPRSFTVKVKQTLSLNQLRLFVGEARYTAADVRELHLRVPLLFRDGKPEDSEQFRVTRDGGFFLGLDLEPDEAGIVGYRAKKNSHVIDMSRTDHEPGDYWELVRGERGGLVLEPEEFYLLMSSESVQIPPQVAAEMRAYDPTSGELRTHYAGFFDPGFGFSRDGRTTGAHAALEVRAHDVAFVVETGQPVCKLVLERMAEEPAVVYGWDIGSAYQHQLVTLGRHFVRPEGARQPVHQLRLLDLPRPGEPSGSPKAAHSGGESLAST